MSEPETSTVRVVGSLRELPQPAWDALANPDPAAFDPFLSHAFLSALEDSGAVGPEATGWLPRHLVLEDARGALLAAMPLYVKLHSQGEYVFDHSWADAFHRAGGRYYPKLQCAVPFTPVPGRRLLVGSATGRALREVQLLEGARRLAEAAGVSSLHITFLTEPEQRQAGKLGFLPRRGQQFHWSNRGYGSFDDFLATLASRKRKAIRKERIEALADGVRIAQLTGPDITEAHWDAFFAFYQDTGDRKWGRPYLNRAFFSALGERLGAHCLLVLATRAGRPIAGALNLIGGSCLYGRYWGAIEHRPFLHFEVCYYQAIEYAIRHGLARVEAGAQGEHKLARGYLPTETYSAHWIADEGLREAIARYLDGERRHVANEMAVLAEYAPYRKSEQERS
ncbi:MAG: GNAT family N-acetyltransferase [Pseudomonadota bacterium]